MNDLDMGFYRKDRKKYAEAVIKSPSQKKLIIAGPGTGKTYIFKSLFGKIRRASGEKGLVLTFIKNLVADLKVELAGLAKVSTFHAFCKSIVHSFKNDRFEYYPNILKLIEKDFDILELDKNNNEDIERCFFGLKSDEVIKSTLKIGDYYNAAGHSDSVYRVVRYYEAYPNRIPNYPLIVFDEYQDFNFLETSLVEVLSKKSPLLIVGDDDQALYAFKQASPDYIRRLVQDP
jgi:superfamily I DNA/RNA helicase